MIVNVRSSTIPLVAKLNLKIIENENTIKLLGTFHLYRDKLIASLFRITILPE